MASTQLADLYDPLTFNEAMQERQIELNAFLASGIMSNDAKLQAHLLTGGNIGELPFYFQLPTSGEGGGGTEPNFSSDDPAVDSVPQKITSGKMIFRSAYQNNSWSAMDLAREITSLSDPLMASVNRVANYWNVNTQNRLIKSGVGVLADNVANDSSDMVVDIANDLVAAITPAEKISADVVIDAIATMGDRMVQTGGFVISMHSVVYAELNKQNLIEFIPNARGETMFATYLGHRVIVDDGMPAVSGVNRITYTTMIFGPGSFGYGQGYPETPSETERLPSSGEGGGQEILYSRVTEIIHPVGFEFNSTTLTGGTGNTQASYADLVLATNWNRVYESRKNVQMAFIKTNG